jgi:alanyl-tRNA synthetase
MILLDNLIKELKSSGKNTIPGTELFKLYDTYGFPLDLVGDIARDNRLNLDEQGFTREMDLQKIRARASWTGTEEEIAGVYKDVAKKTGSVTFLGYETLEAECTVKALIKNKASKEVAHEGETVEIILDKTPFYGESGGQVGDKGTIKAEGLLINVQDTKKLNEVIIHSAVMKKGVLRTGMTVHAAVDSDSRKSVMRNHTATHLLHAALKTTLGDHIKQSGSLVAPERLRFDFTHFYALDNRELQEVEGLVNEKIIENLSINVASTTLDDALNKGVTALFGEKYGEKVRVVKGGDFTAELCGGTHCNTTGEIGPFKIISEGSVAAGIRRIEAITGFTALDFIRKEEHELKKTADLLKVKELQVSEKLEKIIHDLKSKEKELEKIKSKSAREHVNIILDKAIDIDTIKVLAHKIDGFDIKTLRNLADTIKDKIGSGVIVLGSSKNGQASYVAAITKDLIPKLNAGEILKKITGGKGGGRADMAQGGTKDVEGIDDAINSVVDIVQKKLKA